MANITFTEGSGLNDSIFGKTQGPIRLMIEKKSEAFEQESMIPHLFMQDKSNSWAETYSALTAMEGFKPVGENGATPTDGMQESFSKLLVNETWKDSFSISREMLDDAKAVDLKKKPQGFITGYYRTREMFAAALLGSAMAGNASVTFRGKIFDVSAADKQKLFAPAHQSAISGKSLTQCNAFSDTFSADALAAAESAMHQFKGDNGEILNVSPDTILIPNDYKLVKEVFSVIGADKDPHTANNGFNYHFGRWNVIVWPYLNEYIASGSSPWVLLDSRYNEDNAGAIFQDRVALEINSHIDENTHANVWSGYARFTGGFNDWRAFAIGGSKDAGAKALIS